MNYINEEQTSHDGPRVEEGRGLSAFRFTPLPTKSLVLAHRATSGMARRGKNPEVLDTLCQAGVLAQGHCSIRLPSPP